MRRRPVPVTAVVLLAACLAAAATASAARGRTRRLLDGDENLGSPGELAWQAWLLMDGASAAAAGEAGARRITPKSVFIAPAFAPQSLPPCADGHKRDAAGRCVQVVHINRDAQLNFLLQRLNALHARPAPPGRLPLPSRVQDGGGGGPFKVPLPVPLPTAAPATTTTTSTTTTTEQTPSVAPTTVAAAASTGDTEEPPNVSVVMADMAKRSSAEQGSSGESGLENVKPVITVWTIENNTLHKSQDVDGQDASFTVEIPAAAATTTEQSAEETGGDDEAAVLTTKVQAPLSDVLEPSEVEDSLPMLVISPGTAPPPPPTTPMPEETASVAAPATATANRSQTGEGSGEPPESGADNGRKAGQLEDVAGVAGAGTTTERGDGMDSASDIEDDTRETGSADVMEHIEVVPISEHSRHNLPLMGEDHDQDTSFSQSGLAGGIAGMFRPVPLEVIHDSQQRDDTAYNHPVRFPSDASDRDEPQTVHLFKGNYIKFPTEHAYRYKHRPVTEELPDVKQTFWWIPSGWRIDQQRHQSPALQDFWPRMPLSEDPSLLSQYNPSYHSPLPYQQRQAQYDPQWSSMRKQMTS